jgi:uncharacterized protein (DUF1501 family)
VGVVVAAAALARAQDAPAPGPGRVERDITYGTAGGVDLKLDLYFPADAGRGPAPVAVYLHGGGWRGGSKSGGTSLSLHTRREFLRNVGLASVACTVPSFLHRTAWALDNPNKAGARASADEPIVLVIQLSGGNDGLNTIVPYTNDLYFKARPKLAVPEKGVLKIDDTLGFCPEFAPLKPLFDQGKMAVIHGVGYPNPNRSHFRSMEIWHTASDSDKNEKYGWIGRYFDNACQGCGPTAAVNIGKLAPQSFASAAPLGVSLDDPELFQWINSGEGSPEAMRAARDFFKSIHEKSAGAAPASGTAMMGQPGSFDYLQRTAMNAQLSSDLIRYVVKKHRSPVTYPDTALGAGLKLVAQLIAGKLPTRIFYVTHGGFDTHSNQLADQKRLLIELAGAMAAFSKDIEQQGNADRLLSFTFSEFGRRVAENASGGTDHGVAGPIFVFGGKIKAGLHGRHPSLAESDLVEGDLKHDIDFRSVYATVIEKWLGAKSAPILGREYPLLEFV